MSFFRAVFPDYVLNLEGGLGALSFQVPIMVKLSGSAHCGGNIALYQVEPCGEVAPMQAKKRAHHEVESREEEHKVARPVGIQAMSPLLYEQIRRIVVELKLVSEN